MKKTKQICVKSVQSFQLNSLVSFLHLMRTLLLDIYQLNSFMSFMPVVIKGHFQLVQFKQFKEILYFFFNFETENVYENISYSCYFVIINNFLKQIQYRKCTKYTRKGSYLHFIAFFSLQLRCCFTIQFLL